jgi:pimeloyl-ACP methyl ester carboxylesterase
MIEAMVQAGPFETAYRRAGRGATVLLLLAGEDQNQGDWLFGTLGERFRTIAPDLPPELEATPSLLGPWLRALIDGLGLELPAVVASLTHAHALLRFAKLDPDRVGRLLLILRDVDENVPDTEAAFAAGAQVPRRPVRVVVVPASENYARRDGAMVEILDFLAAP